MLPYDMMKDFEMQRLSWIIWTGTKCNYKYFYKRETEGNVRQRGGNETTEA